MSKPLRLNFHVSFFIFHFPFFFFLFQVSDSFRLSLSFLVRDPRGRVVFVRLPLGGLVSLGFRITKSRLALEFRNLHPADVDLKVARFLLPLIPEKSNNSVRNKEEIIFERSYQ